MVWLKPSCKHQAVLSSLTKEKDKARFTVIKNMSFENISVELEHKDNQTEQSLEFLKKFRLSGGELLTREEHDAILKRPKSLTKGKQVFRGTRNHETILMSLILLSKQGEKREMCARHRSFDKEKQKHSLLLLSRLINDEFLMH